MATFRILHVSDLHIAARARQISWPKAWRRPANLLAGWRGGGKLARFASHDYGVYASLVDYVQRHSQHLDAVLLTGDIATTGRAVDQQAAHTLVVGRNPSFASSNVPLWIMPGNHDRFGGSGSAPTVSFAFDAHFGAYWQVGQSAQIMGVLQSGAATLVVIGADFSFATTQPPSGDYEGGGEVYAPVLAELERLTSLVRQRQEDATVIWACHFAPTIDSSVPKEIAGAPKYLRLEKGSDLIQSANHHGVNALLVGHLHNNCSYVALGGARISVAGSACQYLTRFGHWAHVIEIEQDGTGIDFRVLDVRWDVGSLLWKRTEYLRRL